jgi:tetratricopeptide (TPR) repeat protein
MRRPGPWGTAGVGIGIVLMLLVAANVGAGPLNRLLLHLPGVDKVLHLVQSSAIFLALTVLLRRTSMTERSVRAMAAGGAVAAAAFDEIQQGLVGGRSVEFADVAAAIAGIVLCIGLLELRARPRVAAIVVVTGLAAGSGITYTSYLRTRDYNRGLLAEREGRTGDAFRHYQAAVANGVKHPEVYNALAWTMTESGEGDPREAVAFAEQSLALRPGDANTLDTYGWALYRAGRVKEALGPLEQALTLKPSIYCIHYHLGAVYLKLGHKAAAKRHFEAQVQEAPRSKEATLAAALLAQSNWLEATRDR